MQNIITKFEEGKNDKELFEFLTQSGEIRTGEVNIVIIFPAKMRALEQKPELLLKIAEGVIGALIESPKIGVTFVRDIKGVSADVVAGTIKGRSSASIKFSANISSFMEY